MYNADLCHDILFEKVQPQLSKRKDGQTYDEWKKQINEKFIQLLGIEEISKNACPLNVQIESEEQKNGYTQIRFTFDSEVGANVPCYLLIPDTGKEKYPVAIVLQGHSTGFHLSIGEQKYEGDERMLPRASLALQAVQNGFAALAIEQRAMGERRSPRSYGKENIPYPRPHMCAHASLTAIALGRTVLGERIWDVHKAIDALEYFAKCDTDKILITGNSGGGTASFYAACYDKRIKISAPSCSFCAYRTSIFDIEHCACNYIPGVAKWFEMQDLACLIAPRNLIVVTGKEDPIFPIDGVRESFETVKRIYAEVGVADNCQIVETPKGHYWCEDLVWPAVKQATEKLSWK
ncbi:MAG: acetylxylan esterase [Clostridia bacterium]|nr:acetylxylan esterase [Clostridia bacterium]